MKLKKQLSFLVGNTAMAQRMRRHDWTASTLGQPEQWPQSLRSVVHLLLGSAFPMFVTWGPQLELLYNDSYADLLGDKHPAALGTPFMDVWREADADLAPLVQRALAGESFYIENLPLRLRRHGFDEDAWFTFSYSPALDDEDVVAGFYCACVETTAMVQAEQQQRLQQQRLQALFSQTPGFTAVLRGPHHVFEIANQAYLQLTGFRDVLGQTVAQALPEVIEQGFLDLLNQVYETGVPYVGRSVRIMLKRKRGAPLSEAYVNFLYQPIFNASGRVDGIFIQGHDVTQEHQAQQALLAFSNSIPAIAWVASADGRIERVNSQWTRYTGQSEEDALGTGWTAAVHPEDRQAAWQADGRHAEWQGEYRLRRHDGIYHWFMTRAVSQPDTDGSVLRWFGTTTDIEEVRKASDALRDTDRQKDEFLATLAHELRNPLAPIRTAARLLSSAGDDENVRVRSTSVIERQASHMAHLLDDLIDVARITQRRLELKKVTVAVAALVDSAVEAAQPGMDAKSHTLNVRLAPTDGLWVEADPVRMAQVLSNLLNNASKYTDAGGTIELDVRVDGAWLVFAVTDNGIGMTPDTLEKVFVMFAQEQSALERSEGGLGIGLALSKGLVDLHGGEISACSGGPGQGSRFELRLPYPPERADVAAADPHEPGPAQPSQPVTVLLADDNEDSVETLAELLRLDGHRVVTAHDGVQAVALAMQLRPDIVVLDIGMPGLNGYEVARRIRAEPWGAQPLLVAATGWGQDEDRKKSFGAGFELHLTKPFDPQALMDLIAKRATTPPGN